MIVKIVFGSKPRRVEAEAEGKLSEKEKQLAAKEMEVILEYRTYRNTAINMV